MVLISVKKYCVKKGRTYGPYPKDPKTYYLYRVYRNGDSIKQEYVGKGSKLLVTVVQETGGKGVVQELSCRRCKQFTALGSQPFCRRLRTFLSVESLSQICEGFEEE